MLFFDNIIQKHLCTCFSREIRHSKTSSAFEIDKVILLIMLLRVNRKAPHIFNKKDAG